MQRAPHHPHHTALTYATTLAIDLIRSSVHHLVALAAVLLLALLIAIMAQGGWFNDHTGQSPRPTPSTLDAPAPR